MAKKTGEYIPKSEPFEVTVKRWALNAAAQLRDSFATQKIYNGTQNRSFEVWSNRRYRVRKVLKKNRSPKSRKNYGVALDGNGRDGWLAENERRKKLKHDNPSWDVWYSTGNSYRKMKVAVIDGSIEHGIIDFVAPGQLFFVEAGVGATGKEYARGGKPGNIKVDRARPWSHNSRYVGSWIPMMGRTHRPSIRHQASLLSRRMKWLALDKYNVGLTTWLLYSLERILLPDLNNKNYNGFTFTSDSLREAQRESRDAYARAFEREILHR